MAYESLLYNAEKYISVAVAVSITRLKLLLKINVTL